MATLCCSRNAPCQGFTCTEPCPTMCAQAGSNLDNIFNDISTLVKPFIPAINRQIVGAGQPNTVASKIGTFSNQQILLIGGVLVVVALIALHHA